MDPLWLFTLFLVAIFSVALPIILATQFLKRFDGQWRDFFFGVVTGLVGLFLGIIVMIPVGIITTFTADLVFDNPMWAVNYNVVVFEIVSSIAEVGSLFLFLLVAFKQIRSWVSAILFGIGFGGILFSQWVVMFLSNAINHILVFGFYVEQVRFLIVWRDSLLTLSSAYFDLCSIALYIAFSLMTLRAARGSRFGWFIVLVFTSITIETIDWALGQSVGRLAEIGFYTLVGILAIWFIYREYKIDNANASTCAS